MSDTAAPLAGASGTDAMLATLLARWCARLDPATDAPDAQVPYLQQARRKVQQTLGGYLRWMSESDLSLYRRLMTAHDADEWSAQFFLCFDLMVRTRGAAIAVLRMHELFRLLQPHVTR